MILKIKDNIDLKILKKYGFKEIQQNQRVNFIYFPGNYLYSKGNHICVNNDRNLFNLDYYIGEDRYMTFRFNEALTSDFDKTMCVLFDLIKADLIEKGENNGEKS